MNPLLLLMLWSFWSPGWFPEAFNHKGTEKPDFSESRVQPDAAILDIRNLAILFIRSVFGENPV